MGRFPAMTLPSRKPKPPFRLTHRQLAAWRIEMDDNVIHLEFKSPHVESDVMAFIGCRTCKNKTYTLIDDRVGDFPLMRCAACGQHIGRMGWVRDDGE